MIKPLCSKCSPLYPFAGTELQREQAEDKIYNMDGTLSSTTMYCGVCKHHFIFASAENIPTDCPACHAPTKWAVARTWRLVCPKCGS